jgi:hypothetical protein
MAMYRSSSLIMAVLFAVSGCASRDKAAEKPPSLSDNMGGAAQSAAGQTRDGLGNAALSPLEDFNLRRDKIPPVIAMIENPYDLPVDLTCPDLTRLIAELDRALGADWDNPQPDERLRTEQLADSAAAAALEAISDEARGLIPFRDVVRKATGADSHEKRLSLAYKLGAQRRAYLKGYGIALNCEGKAKPDFTKMPGRTIEYRGDQPSGSRKASSRSIWSRATPWKEKPEE